MGAANKMLADLPTLTPLEVCKILVGGVSGAFDEITARNAVYRFVILRNAMQEHGLGFLEPYGKTTCEANLLADLLRW